MNDLTIAQKYINKAKNAESQGIEFNLSFAAFKNLMRAKKCQYTGIKLTDIRPGKKIRSTDRTIDRINNSLGYVSGNVIAVCNSANQLKSNWENPNSPLNLDVVKKIIKQVDRRVK